MQLLKDETKLRVERGDPRLVQIDHYPELYEYDGKPFNGYKTYGFGPNDNPDPGVTIRAELEYRDGFRMGWSRRYYPNGNVKLERLDYFDTPLLSIYYNEQGVEVHRYQSVSKEWYDSIIAENNVLDK